MNKMVKSGLIAILTTICSLGVALLLVYLIEIAPGLTLGLLLIFLLTIILWWALYRAL